MEDRDALIEVTQLVGKQAETTGKLTEAVGMTARELDGLVKHVADALVAITEALDGLDKRVRALEARAPARREAESFGFGGSE